MLMALVLFLVSCRTEDASSDSFSSETQKEKAKVYLMKDVPAFKNFLETKINSSNYFSKSNSYAALLFDNQPVDVVKKGNKTSYSTFTKKDDTVYEILVYTTGEKESFFIAQYISNTPIPYLDLTTFSGTVHYKSYNGELISSLSFENGIAKTAAKNAVKTATGCYTVITTPVSCIEGLHFPGKPCAYEGTINAAYYDTQIINSCFQDEFYNEIGNGGSYGPDGGAGSNPAYSLPAPSAINYMLTQIGMQSLNTQQFSYLQNHLMEADNLRAHFLANQNVGTANFLYWVLTHFMNNSQTADYFKNHLDDLEKIKLEGIDYSKSDQIQMANALAPIFTELIIAEQNNTVNQINVQNPIWKFAKDYMIYLIKNNAPKAVEYGRIIYEHSNKYFKTHPNSLQKVNDFIEFMKIGVLAEVPIITNPHYMKWTDVLVCWLFEIGDFPVNDSAGYGNLPTIGFAGADYTISGDPSSIIPMRYLSAHRIKNGIPDENSVLGIKKKAIDNIKLGNYESVQGNWIFGSDATVDTIVKLDGMQFCIGSYQPIVYITPLGGNQYKLTFIIKNKTGWTSGTRGLNDYNGDPTDDSIITDQPRGTGVHLGGTIAETFGWYEIITVN